MTIIRIVVLLYEQGVPTLQRSAKHAGRVRCVCVCALVVERREIPLDRKTPPSPNGLYTATNSPGSLIQYVAAAQIHANNKSQTTTVNREAKDAFHRSSRGAMAYGYCDI